MKTESEYLNEYFKFSKGKTCEHVTLIQETSAAAFKMFEISSASLQKGSRKQKGRNIEIT